MRHNLDAIFAALLFGCSSRAAPTSSASTTTPAPAETSDASTPEDVEADASVEPPSTTCVVKRAASSGACAEDCDARLTLPAGGVYCSRQCETDADCTGVDLFCPATIGACVPRCTSDSSCTEAGFLRCDAEVGGCDTI